MSENTADELSDGLRELGAATVVAEADGREISLDREVMLSDALLERRRWKGLRCAREAMELSRFMELRRDSDEGATSLESDFREGILVPFECLIVVIVGIVMEVYTSCGTSAEQQLEVRSWVCAFYAAVTSWLLPAQARKERPGKS